MNRNHLSRAALFAFSTLAFACEPAVPAAEQAPVAASQAALTSACTSITGLFNKMLAPMNAALVKANQDVATYPGYTWPAVNRDSLIQARNKYNAIAVEGPAAAAGQPGSASNVSGTAVNPLVQALPDKH